MITFTRSTRGDPMIAGIIPGGIASPPRDAAPEGQPTDRSPDGPIEAAGGERSDVRLLVATGDGLVHRQFSDLPALLTPGDLLVVNTSATLPAAIPVHGQPDRLVHLSGRLADGTWLVELRRACRRGSEPDDGGHAGLQIPLPGEARVLLLDRFSSRHQRSRRLWKATLDAGAPLLKWLSGVGRPIRYGCAATVWPLPAFQTVFAAEPGSAEMPSAGRPFTDRLVTRLVAAGVELAPIVLHTGVSSLEKGEMPYPEWFSVPTQTARRVERARADRRRVIAVGTTVVRALESAAGSDAQVRPGSGWTELVVGPDRGVTVVDGLITGWHDPQATHLDMLEAVAGRALVEASYAAAAVAGYVWHEFGDSHLLLPRSTAGGSGGDHTSRAL